MRETPTPPTEPVSFLAAAAALAAIDDAVRTTRTPAPTHPTGLETADGPEPALAALVLLRELRTELAGWEAGLVEFARATGATWADLAQPMGVASRQAAENRYLRLRPAPTAPQTTATGAERVKAVRDRRAAERTVTAWARDNAADLRVLAAQISALTDLPPEARPDQNAVRTALGAPDAADLIAPLASMRPHLRAGHPDLTTRLDDLTNHTAELRHDSNRRRA
ncbi:hypothetical protein OG500_11340 [Kitasatospora sp. NBC_01250]|uniref:hypothetical protein n=1 Tax=unclassified Kitasatospora TaxID=2633591 RepID=UPI002E107B44|nr:MULTISPECIES: hypothetical protein [unclassified Kitasatospora]WSJ66743.1 hypothetical protein OG294_11750 [Kitasatospora sp. NBC_01302]